MSELYGWKAGLSNGFREARGFYLIIVLAVLVAANFLANRYNKSFDSTANKRFRCNSSGSP